MRGEKGEQGPPGKPGATIILTSCPEYSGNHSYSGSGGGSGRHHGVKSDKNGYCPPSRVTVKPTDDEGVQYYPLGVVVHICKFTESKLMSSSTSRVLAFTVHARSGCAAFGS